MALLARLVQQFRWRNRLPQLAEAISDQVIEEVWQRVAERVVQMSSAESRGYTRVLAARALRRQVDLCLMWLQLPAHWQPQLVALANDKMIARVTQRAQAMVRCAPTQRRAA